MATYVNDLRLKEITTGDESGTWGTSTNTNLELIAEAFSYGTEVITTNADTHTTTIADGATDPGRALYLKYTGTLDSACTITIGPNTVSKVWIIENGTSGSQDIILSQGSGANITIPAGDTKVVYSDGAGAGAAFFDAFASLNVVDLKVQDDLTVTGDIDVDGTTNLDVVDIDGALTQDGGAVFNETGADVDFRVESDTVDHALFVQGSDGNVGIGTSSPASALHVVDSGNPTLTISGSDGAYTTILKLQAAGGGSSVINATGATSDNLILQTNDTERMRIDASGGLITKPAAGGHAVFNENSVDADFRVESDGNANMLFVDGGNNRVGIGINAPTSLLHLYKTGTSDNTLQIQNAQDDYASILQVTANNDNGAIYNSLQSVTNGGTQHFKIWGGAAVSQMMLTTGGVERAKLNTSGTVFNDTGIDQDFRVESDGNTHMLFVDAGLNLVGFNAASVASDNGASFLVYVGGMKVDIGHNGSAANADEYIAFKRLGITLGSITQVSSTGVAYNTTSDQRLKENIADADDAGSKIDAIQVRQFDWKIDGSHQDYGMVAQELQAVAPEAVSAPEDLDEMMSVDYSKLVPMLIKEIQTLRLRITALENA
jgi:hypothetical protein